MKNRFAKCNSLVDIYNVACLIPGCDVSYCTLSDAEKDTVLNVYCSANVDGAQTLERPLSEAGYQEILRNTTTIIGGLYAAAKNIKSQEDKNMKKNNKGLINKVNGFYAGVAGAVGSATVQAGQDYNDFKASCDGAVTSIKDNLSGVLVELDYLTGATALKNQLMGIIYKDTVGTKSRRGFFDCASECRAAVHSYIDSLLEWDPDEDDLKTVISLRYMLGEDEEGNPTGRRSIFAAFANGIVWICKKVARKLRSWFGTDAETNIFGSVGAGIASVFGIACGVIKGVVEIAVNFVVFVGSYILSAAINAIAWVVEKVSGWIQKAKDKFSGIDELEDEELDEELFAEEETEGAI